MKLQSVVNGSRIRCDVPKGLRRAQEVQGTQTGEVRIFQITIKQYKRTKLSDDHAS